MTVSDPQIDMALIVAQTAECNDAALSNIWPQQGVSSARRIGTVRNLIERFLQNCPEDATVHELRLALEECA